MEIEKEKVIALSEDDKAVSLKTLSDLFYAARQLHEWVKDNTLTEEMKETLFSLIESHTANTAKVLGYNSDAEWKIEERYKEIRQANNEIHALEQKLAENTPISGLKELLYALHMGLYDWWKLQGFNLVTDDAFGIWGYKGRFYLDTRHMSFMSTHPVKEKKEHKSRLEQMMEEGYEFVIDDRDYVLLDTPNNREKITALVKAKLPSLYISKWENWCLHKKEGFQLRSFEGYIRNLEELKALMEEMKQLPQED